MDNTNTATDNQAINLIGGSRRQVIADVGRRGSQQTMHDISHLRQAVLDVAARRLWFPGLVFIIHVVASRGLDAYEQFPPLDIPMHLLGGVAIAYFIAGALTALGKQGIITIQDSLMRHVLMFSLVCTSTVFWEFAEYTSDHTIGTHAQLGLDDTLFDMLLGILGGSAFLLSWGFAHRHQGNVQQTAATDAARPFGVKK